MMVLSAYDTNAYHALGHVQKTCKMVTEEDLNGVGQIILDHGYEKLMSVVIAHRHFKLSPNEVMFETLDNDDDGDVRIAKPIDADKLSSLGGQPNLIVCGSDNVWRPVQYGVGKSLSAWNDPTFMENVAKYLIENNLHDKLMLGIRDDNDILALGEYKFMEKNNIKTRTSEIRLTNSNEKIFDGGYKTTYIFVRNENGETEHDNNKVCCSCCNTGVCSDSWC